MDIEVAPAQFICGHTPMREMVEQYETILVIGGEGEKCRQVAEGYGFRDVVTPGDIIKDNAATTPFRKLTTEEHAASKTRDYGSTKIEAILYVHAANYVWIDG
jgi:ribonucleotide monophosphatase NagD (HAD superfamily)